MYNMFRKNYNKKSFFSLRSKSLIFHLKPPARTHPSSSRIRAELYYLFYIVYTFVYDEWASRFVGFNRDVVLGVLESAQRPQTQCADV